MPAFAAWRPPELHPLQARAQIILATEAFQWLMRPLISLAKETMIKSKTSVCSHSFRPCLQPLRKVLRAWALVRMMSDVPFDSGECHAEARASMTLHSAQMLTGST